MGKLFSGKTKTKNSSLPWDEVIPYLTGGDSGTPGVFPGAADLFKNSGWNDQMQSGIDDYRTELVNRYAENPTLRNSIYSVGSGELDPNFENVKNMRGVANITGSSARSLQGGVNPEAALNQLLTGKVNTEYLDPLAANITSNITRNYAENALPQIRSGAVGAGQYGGSRQGIAEGLALSRMNQDIATGISPMYASAYENSQNRMQGTADALDARAFAMAMQNAQNQLGTQQFNANLGLNRNQQELAGKSAMLNNRSTAFDALNQLNSNTDTGFQNYLDTLMMPQNTNWNNLNNYANVMLQGASLGGTGKGTTSQTPGIIPAVLGTAAGIGGVGRMFGKFGG